MEDKPGFTTPDAPPAIKTSITQELPLKEFQLKGKDNQEFKLKIIEGQNNIIFQVDIVDNDINTFIYKKVLSLKDFYESNKIFKQYDSIKDLFFSYFQSLSDSEILISYEDNKIKLCFIIEYRNQKIEIPFILNKEKADISNIVNNLIDKIKNFDEIKMELDQQKLCNENLKKDFQKSQTENEKIINELKLKLDNLIEENKKNQKNYELEKDLYIKKDKLLNLIYPIGSLYISINNLSPSDFLGGKWEQIKEGYALWTCRNNAGNTISSGLPNIKGSIGKQAIFNNATASGAFSVSDGMGFGGGEIGFISKIFSFDASKSNSIYGNSSIVQPPAYKVYAWRRTE